MWMRRGQGLSPSLSQKMLRNRARPDYCRCIDQPDVLMPCQRMTYKSPVYCKFLIVVLAPSHSGHIKLFIKLFWHFLSHFFSWVA